MAWFNAQGVECRQVMSDNCSVCVSRSFAMVFGFLGPKHMTTCLYSLCTNGKAGRFIQNLCKEWAYVIPFQNSQERISLIPRYLSIYNRNRRHLVLSGHPLSSGLTSCSPDLLG